MSEQTDLLLAVLFIVGLGVVVWVLSALSDRAKEKKKEEYKMERAVQEAKRRAEERDKKKRQQEAEQAKEEEEGEFEILTRLLAEKRAAAAQKQKKTKEENERKAAKKHAADERRRKILKAKRDEVEPDNKHAKDTAASQAESERQLISFSAVNGYGKDEGCVVVSIEWKGADMLEVFKFNRLYTDYSKLDEELKDRGRIGISNTPGAETYTDIEVDDRTNYYYHICLHRSYGYTKKTVSLVDKDELTIEAKVDENQATASLPVMMDVRMVAVKVGAGSAPTPKEEPEVGHKEILKEIGNVIMSEIQTERDVELTADAIVDEMSLDITEAEMVREELMARFEEYKEKRRPN